MASQSAVSSNLSATARAIASSARADLIASLASPHLTSPQASPRTSPPKRRGRNYPRQGRVRQGHCRRAARRPRGTRRRFCRQERQHRRTAGVVDNILSQVDQATKHPARLKSFAEDKKVTQVFVVVAGRLSSNARIRIQQEVRGIVQDIWDLDRALVTDFTEHYPSSSSMAWHSIFYSSAS